MLTTFYFFVVYLLILYWLFVDQGFTGYQKQPVAAPATAPATVSQVTSPAHTHQLIPKPAAVKAMSSGPRAVVVPAQPMPPIRKLKKLASGKGIKGYQNMPQSALYSALKERGLVT